MFKPKYGLMQFLCDPASPQYSHFTLNRLSPSVSQLVFFSFFKMSNWLVVNTYPF